MDKRSIEKFLTRGILMAALEYTEYTISIFLVKDTGRKRRVVVELRELKYLLYHHSVNVHHHLY